MSIEPGTTLGPYAVTSKIGEGGMGEVYRARDTKLDRDVALKVLPEAFTSDMALTASALVLSQRTEPFRRVSNVSMQNESRPARGRDPRGV